MDQPGPTPLPAVAGPANAGFQPIAAAAPPPPSRREAAHKIVGWECGACLASNTVPAASLAKAANHTRLGTIAQGRPLADQYKDQRGDEERPGCPDSINRESRLVNAAGDFIKLVGGLNLLADRLTPAGWMCCVDREVHLVPGPALAQQQQQQQQQAQQPGRNDVECRKAVQRHAAFPHICQRCFITNRFGEVLLFTCPSKYRSRGQQTGWQFSMPVAEYEGGRRDFLPDGAFREHCQHFRLLDRARARGSALAAQLLAAPHATPPPAVFAACLAYAEALAAALAAESPGRTNAQAFHGKAKPRGPQKCEPHAEFPAHPDIAALEAVVVVIDDDDNENHDE
ncbi:hypothetical protein B0T24DRAFT_683259 [Lasiosphaeria ovina]|uniref:Uncharacterized protein n=1 Tax=Lasiosphaeria ovina TaxID=92902 RepID=A0AAE0N0I8_9PEZI|nr:hypothetical protein B0T24DRAFT_683259 [Lasiosphaeria ovina]